MDSLVGPTLRRPIAALAIVILAVTGFLAPPPEARAALNAPQPADGAGELVDTLTTRDALFAYVLSDVAGGRICVIADTGAGDCDDPAWGTPNVVVGIGTTYTLLEGPSLKPGAWRLHTETGSGETWFPNQTSEVFTVTPCGPGECLGALGREQADSFKRSSGEATRGAKSLCTALSAEDNFDVAVPLVKGDYASATAAAAGLTVISKVPIGDVAKHFLSGISCNVAAMHEDILKDPPDPAYATVALADVSFPEGDYGSPARREYAEALAEQRGYGRATLVAFERYQGAAIDAVTLSEEAQARAVSVNGFAAVDALRRSARAARALASSTATPDLAIIEQVAFSSDAERSQYQQILDRIRSTGFTAAELAELASAEFTADERTDLQRQLSLHSTADLAVGESTASALYAQAAFFDAAVAGLDLFARDALNVADGLAALNLPGLDDDVASIELTATPAEPEVGEEVCFGAVPLGGDGRELRGGPFTVRTSSTGYLELTQTLPYLFNHYGSVFEQCLTVSEPASMTLTLGIGAQSSSVTVEWTLPTPGNRAPFAVSTNVETRPGTPIDLRLVAGDDDGDTLTYSVTSPRNGTITGTAPFLTYTPLADTPATSDQITFRVNDGTASSGDGFLRIYIGDDAVDRTLPVVSLDQAEAGPYRQPVPLSLAGVDVVDVAGGGQPGSFALDSGGLIHAWGGTDWISTTDPTLAESYWKVPAALQAKDVAAIESDGNGYHIARDVSGLLTAWGVCGNDLPRAIEEVPVTDFDASASAGIALLASGEILPWNRWRYSDDGDPTTGCALATEELPEQLLNERFSQAEAGGFLFTALTASGDIVTWENSNVGWLARFSFPGVEIATVDADLYEVAAVTTGGKAIIWNYNVSGSHNSQGTKRLATGAAARVVTGLGPHSPLAAITDSGELRLLRHEQTGSSYLAYASSGVPQELLRRRVTDVSSAQLGGLALAPPTTTRRLAGPDRYSTAVEISKDGFGPGVPVVYVATGTNFPDALTAAPAAARQGGPLLLVTPTSVPGAVAAELDRLDPKLIVVVGGSGAVSDAVYSQLAPFATKSIRRDAGSDRYQTAGVVVERAFSSSPTAYVATGANFPDALSARAAAAKSDAPVLLVPGGASTLPTATRDQITRLGTTTVFVAGGTAVVTAAIERAIEALPGISASRLAGADRYATSSAINRHAFTEAATLYLATGSSFADALAGAALAGAGKSPLYVIPRTCVPPAVLQDIEDFRVIDIVLLGGTGALAPQVAGLTRC